MFGPFDATGGQLSCTLDRFEESEDGERLAVLVFDDGQQLVVKADVLPEGAKEGAVLRLTLAVDESETEARRQSIKSLQDELFRD